MVGMAANQRKKRGTGLRLLGVLFIMLGLISV